MSGTRPDRPERESVHAASAALSAWREDLHTAAGSRGCVHPVVTAVATCVDALDGVRGTGLGTLTAPEVRILLCALARLATVAAAVKLRLRIAAEAWRVAELTGATSTPRSSRT